MKYLREYFEQKKEEYTLIIREKIILVIFHELNHLLMREIDSSKKNNFLINNKVKGKKRILKFKSISNDGIFSLPINESGNNFDYLLSDGYYIDKIDKDVAELFLIVSKFHTRENFTKLLVDNLKKMNVKDDNIFKFKKNYYSNISKCGFSLNRSYQIKKKKEKFSNYDSD